MAKRTDEQIAGVVNRRQFLVAAAGVGVAPSALGAAAASESTGQAPTAGGPGTSSSPYKIGMLGSGFVTQLAMINPIKQVPELRLDAVGSRSAERGREFADKNGIPRSMDYETLIRDPAIDIVYIALPISLHAEWTIRALEAGKHVLCEKSMTANAAEAASVAGAVRKSGRVFMEGYHYPYHPFWKRVHELLNTRAIGPIKSVEATFDALPMKLTQPENIRGQFETGGGALLDAGCYPLSALYYILGDHQKVVSAKAGVFDTDRRVDLSMAATLTFSGGVQGTLHTDWRATTGKSNVTVHGDAGTLTIDRFFMPHSGGSLRMEWDGRSYTEKADTTSTFVYQLRELARCIRDGAPVLTSADNGARIMRAADAIYKKSGLSLRGVA
jgi:predicted dehydrogenase